MSAIGDQSLLYVRRSPAERLPPPAARAGAVGWLRSNLFSSPANMALTLVCILFIVWAVPPLLRFFLIDAVWSGTDRDACLAVAGATASRRLLGLRPRLALVFRLRLLPGRRTLAGRCFLLGFGRRHCLAGAVVGAAP